MYAGQETLQPFEVAVAFDSDKLRLPFLPCLMPLLCDSSRTVSRVGYTNQPEPCSLDQSLVLSWRTVHVKANRAPRGDFFVGKHSADYQRVAEQHSSARLENAKHLAQHCLPSGKMAQDIVREDRVKGVVVKREILRGVTLLEMYLRGAASGRSELVRILNSGRIDVQTHQAAAHSLRKV